MLGRLVLTFVALAVVTAPLAYAGPGGSVDTLAREGECASTSESWSYSDGGTIYDRPTPPRDNETAPPPPAPADGNDTDEPVPIGHWYSSGSSRSESTSCTSETTYASASARDAEGEVVSGRAYASNASSHHDSRRHSSDGAWYYSGHGSWNSADGWSFSHSESDRRGVEVASVAGDAAAGSGCSQDWSTQGHGRQGSYYGPEGSSSYGNSRDASQADWGCGEDATVSAAERDVAAGRGERCSYSHESTGWSYGDRWSNDSSSGWDGSASSRCRNGVTAQAQGEDVFVGREDACESERHNFDGPVWTPNGTARRSTEYGTDRCFSGVVADGPAGADAKAGVRSYWSSYCEDGACASWGNWWWGATFAWQDSPLGPREQSVGTWLP